MIFERTTNGLSNAHLFHAVDFIVYAEGKYDETKADLVSLDQCFWRSILEAIEPTIRFKVLSRGGKPALISIANEIIQGNISNTLVAMDRDYDFECGNNLSHPKVIYTLGYSWENDVWRSDALMGIVKEMLLGDTISQEKTICYEKCINDFYRNAIRIAKANLVSKKNGNEHVVTSSHMKGIVKTSRGKLPKFNRQCFCSAIKSSTVTRPIYMNHAINMTEGHIQGHLLAHFGYQFVCSVLSDLSQSAAVSIEILSNIAIKYFKACLTKAQDIRNVYYKNCISNAVA